MNKLAFKLGLASVLLGTISTLAFAQNNTPVDYAYATECAALLTFVSMLIPEDNPGRKEMLETAESWSVYALGIAPEKALIHASSVTGNANTLAERAQAAEYDQQVLEEMLAPVDGKCRVVPVPQAEPVQEADPANPGYAEAIRFIETCDKIGGFALLQE